MIVVEVKLVSYHTGKTTMLQTLVLDNVTSAEKVAEHGGRRCDYRARVLKKGAEWLNMAYGLKPIRSSVVESHPRHSKPVLNLVYKALVSLGYDK